MLALNFNFASRANFVLKSISLVCIQLALVCSEKNDIADNQMRQTDIQPEVYAPKYFVSGGSKRKNHYERLRKAHLESTHS